MTTHTMLKATISTECSCQEFIGIEPDGTHLYAQLDDCFGCGEDDYDWAWEVVETWFSRQPIQSDKVRVYGVGMGWQRRDGHLITETTRLIDSVRLNGDYRIIFTLDGTELRATRYSHDEPTGASFAFKLITEEDDI